MLKTEAQKSGEAVLKIAAEAATTSKKGKGKAAAAASKAGGSRTSSAGGPSRADAPEDPIKRELDAEIEKLRGLLVRGGWRATNEYGSREAGRGQGLHDMGVNIHS